jgi:predicted dehydrogenase
MGYINDSKGVNTATEWLEDTRAVHFHHWRERLSMMPKKVRWGVLGAARIGLNRVIPAMQNGALSEVTAIASRDLAKAQAAGLPKAYGSYEELLADPDVDAIYNPLPNHLHVPWTIRAAEAGKHVLCEKPIAMDASEARTLIEVRDRTRKKIGEAFMVRVHPQWLRAREMVRSGEIGNLRAVSGFFSYNNQDPKNIRNIPEYGGGGIMDIGCYPITMTRFLFGEEPSRVIALMERDPEMGTDRLTSAMMEFPSGQGTFTCSTQLNPYQRILAVGTKGKVELEIPFNPTPEQFDGMNQFTLQGDAFSRAILEDTEVPVPLEDSVHNMEVIDAVFRSAKSGAWERP